MEVTDEEIQPNMTIEDKLETIDWNWKNAYSFILLYNLHFSKLIVTKENLRRLLFRENYKRELASHVTLSDVMRFVWSIYKKEEQIPARHKEGLQFLNIFKPKFPPIPSTNFVEYYFKIVVIDDSPPPSPDRVPDLIAMPTKFDPIVTTTTSTSTGVTPPKRILQLKFKKHD